MKTPCQQLEIRQKREKNGNKFQLQVVMVWKQEQLPLIWLCSLIRPRVGCF